MKYEPKVLINRTGKRVEFLCGGRTYIFEVGEKKPLDGFAAHHALKQVNTGLEEYIEEDYTEKRKPDYSEMSWAELRKLAKEKGYKVGMSRKEVVSLLESA